MQHEFIRHIPYEDQSHLIHVRLPVEHLSRLDRMARAKDTSRTQEAMQASEDERLAIEMGELALSEFRHSIELARKCEGPLAAVRIRHDTVKWLTHLDDFSARDVAPFVRVGIERYLAVRRTP